LPRFRSYSAAGALAAALLAAPAPQALAQYVSGAPLRGSIPENGRATGASGDDASAADSGQASAPGGTAAQPAGDATPDAAPEPSNQAGPLGGLGDVPQLPEPELTPEPAFGLTTEPGESGIEIPGTSDVARHSATAPERHDLDPYVPIGIRLGTFLLFPEVAMGTILTDNVLGTHLDPHSDAALEVAPKLRLDSDWSRNFFSAEINADRSWYQDFPVEDDRDYQILLKGRIDVTSRTHAALEAEKSQTQEGRNSISLTDIAGNQTDLHEQHLTAAADHTFNRLTLKLTGTVADYNYDDSSDPTQVGGVPFVDIRDYREDEAILRTSYELKPSMTGFVQGELNERDYKQEVNSEGIRRGSSGAAVLAGLTLNLTGRLTGEVSAGFGEQQSIDPSLSPIEGPLFNADLIWLPSPITKVELLARSEIDETTLVDSLGAIDRFYELSLQHAFWTFFVGGGYVSYEIADYVDDPLVDQRVKEGLTADYYFNPMTSVYARYEHTNFISTDPGSDFVENEVRLGITLRR
jgi:hypothetical protein